MLPRVLDKRRASSFTGCFEVRVRGGERFVLRIADGTACSEPADSQRVDCVLSWSGYHALLMGYERVPRGGRSHRARHGRSAANPGWLQFDRLFMKV